MGTTPPTLRIALSACLAAGGVLLAWVIAGLYAQADVFADDYRGHVACGSAWDPNAETSACANALQQRSWVAVALLGVAVFAAIAGVVAAARTRPMRALLAILAATALLTVLAGFVWAGVVERTTGV